MAHKHFYDRRIAVTGPNKTFKRRCICGALGPWTRNPDKKTKPGWLKRAQQEERKPTVASFLLMTKAELIEAAKKVDHSTQPSDRFQWNTKTTKDTMVNDLVAAYGI